MSQHSGPTDTTCVVLPALSLFAEGYFSVYFIHACNHTAWIISWHSLINCSYHLFLCLHVLGGLSIFFLSQETPTSSWFVIQKFCVFLRCLMTWRGWDDTMTLKMPVSFVIQVRVDSLKEGSGPVSVILQLVFVQGICDMSFSWPSLEFHSYK